MSGVPPQAANNTLTKSKKSNDSFVILVPFPSAGSTMDYNGLYRQALGNCLGLPSIHLATLFRENSIQHSLVNHERMGLAFQLQKVNRACANVIAHRRIGLRADQDLSLPGYR